MLKKCLKYDLSAIWRVWWILALVAVGAGVLGCAAIRSGSVFSGRGDFLGTIVSIFSVLGILASILALAAFVVMTFFLIYFRFYKHFFSDEGYLTFALPVKRSTLYLSKVLNAMVWLVASVLLIVLIVIGILLCTDTGITFSDIIDVLSLKWMRPWSGAWSIAYLIEALGIVLGIALLQCGILHFCITVGAVIAKKHKIIAAIGIYYGFSIVLGFVMEILSIPATIGLIEAVTSILDKVNAALYQPLLALVLLAICAAIVTFAFLLHHVTLALIERKLNLE